MQNENEGDTGTFKIGDVVCLKGQEYVTMTVIGSSDNFIKTMRFTPDGILKTDEFPFRALKKC